MFKRKPKALTPEELEVIHTKDFFDMILPSTVKFLSDHYIVGDSYRCVWVIREYPPFTEEQALLSQLADRNGVTIRIYHRLVEAMEQRKIIQNATRRNKLKSGGNDVNETIEAEGNLQDVVELLANLRKNKEPLLHCSVFIELKARNMEALKELQSEIAMELTRSKISVDRLTLRQKEGFLSVLPVGANMFGSQYERVLPASSVANLYSAYWNIWNVLISLAVYLAFQVFIFSRMVKKHTIRIVGYEEEKQFFLKFFDVKTFCIMGFMIALGVGLRISGICPDIFIAVFYTGLGASLLTAGILFLVNFVRNQPSPLPEADRTELCEIADKTESSEETSPSAEKESELSPLS